MIRIGRRVKLLGAVVVSLSLVLGGQSAIAQRGGGTLTFLNARPPRDFHGDIRGWAAGHRATAYEEDTTNHVWRINMFVFMARPPNVVSLTLTWFRVDGRVSRYLSNETINVGDPTQRILFHTTTVRRSAGEFDPMEQYEAQISVNDSRGARELARGRIRLNGQVERHSGVVDFTGAQPQVR
jgi:hypothetical protein